MSTNEMIKAMEQKSIATVLRDNLQAQELLERRAAAIPLPGELVLPRYFFSFYPACITTKTFTWFATNDQSLTGYWYQNSPADGDEFSWPVVLDAGTYTFAWCGLTYTNAGKVDWYLDGTVIQSGQDWYSASIAYSVVKTFSYAVAAGAYTLKVKVSGKNASSTNYYLFGTYLYIMRTGD